MNIIEGIIYGVICVSFFALMFWVATKPNIDPKAVTNPDPNRRWIRTGKFWMGLLIIGLLGQGILLVL